MVDKSMMLGGDLLKYTDKLEKLKEAVGRLEGARIVCHVSLDVCYLLMTDAIRAGDDERDEAIKAFAYAIKITARQVRLQIAQNPRRATMMKNIALDNKRVDKMSLGTYRALAPFAFREFEFV